MFHAHHALKSMLLLTSILAFSACSKTPEASVELSEETKASIQANSLKKLPLSATFLSESGEVAYTLDYEGMKYKLISNPLREGSQYGANFMAEGGIEMSSRTLVSGTLPKEWENAPMKNIGEYTFSVGATKEDSCELDYAYLPVKNEYLVFEAKTCEGDAPVAKEALEELLEGLSF